MSRAKPVPAPVRSVADTYRDLANARVQKSLADIHPDEAAWALETLPQTLINLKKLAEAGGVDAAVDIPESDITAPNFLRGGGAALKARLEGLGFTVTLGHRYAGHSSGEYFLQVSW